MSGLRKDIFRDSEAFRPYYMEIIAKSTRSSGNRYESCLMSTSVYNIRKSLGSSKSNRMRTTNLLNVRYSTATLMRIRNMKLFRIPGLTRMVTTRCQGK